MSIITKRQPSIKRIIELNISISGGLKVDWRGVENISINVGSKAVSLNDRLSSDSISIKLNNCILNSFKNQQKSMN